MRKVLPQFPANKKFIPALTGVRAYFSLWVMLYHYDIVMPDLHTLTLLNQGHHATNFFLILSGFSITLAYKKKLMKGDGADFKNFLWKRFAKLYPLHLATFLVIVLFRLSFFVIGFVPKKPADFSLSAAIYNLFMVHAWIPALPLSWNYVSWTVSAECFAYVLLFPALVYWAEKFPVWQKAVILLGLFALSLSLTPESPVVPYYLLRSGYCFILGSYLADSLPKVERYREKTWLWPGLIVFSLSLGLAIAQWGEGSWIAHGMDLLWCVLLVSLVFAKGPFLVIFTNRLTMHLGKISYSSYLVHGVLSRVLFVAVGLLPAMDWHLHLAGLIGFTLLTFYAASLVDHYFTVPAGEKLLELRSRAGLKVRSLAMLRLILTRP